MCKPRSGPQNQSAYGGVPLELHNSECSMSHEVGSFLFPNLTSIRFFYKGGVVDHSGFFFKV